MNSAWIASYIVLWLVVAALVFLLMGLLRQLGLVQLRIGVDPGVLITKDGLPRGTEAPDFEAFDVQTSHLVRLSSFRGKRVALVFLTPTCLACRELVPHINEMADVERGRVTFLAIMFASGMTSAEFMRRYQLRTPLLADMENAIATSYGVSATPSAYLIDEDGFVLIRGVVNSWSHLDALLKEEGTLQRAESPWETEAARRSEIVESAHDSDWHPEAVQGTIDVPVAKVFSGQEATR